MPGTLSVKEKRRQDRFADRVRTRLWKEIPSSHNPYLAERCLCHGYDLLRLVERRDFVDVLFLIFRGELPSTDAKRLLNGLLVACISPGPRHPATRAAQTAGAGKTNPCHVLPVALSIAGGDRDGGGEVSRAMRFLSRERKNPPTEAARRMLGEAPIHCEGDRRVAPGFGSRFGDIDIHARNMARTLIGLTEIGPNLQWGQEFSDALEPDGAGWLATGVVAAALSDLGFRHREGAGLFQILCAPGLLAHGLELYNKPITAMPFVDDGNYVIES